MTAFEYKVVPAPSKGEKAKGVRGAEAKFAYAIEKIMNELGAVGWEYQRSDTLPSEERSGLTNTVTTYRSVMVFRRGLEQDISAFQPKLLDPPRIDVAPVPEQAAIALAPAPVALSDADQDTAIGDAADAPANAPAQDATFEDAFMATGDGAQSDEFEDAGESVTSALMPSPDQDFWADNGVEQAPDGPDMNAALRARAARVGAVSEADDLAAE